MSDDAQESLPNDSAARMVPAWALDAFKECGEHQQQLFDVLRLSKSSIQAAHVFAKGEPPSTGLSEFVNLAKSEIEKDFPTLHSQGVVALWGSLEATMLDVVASWILNRPEVLHGEPWRNLKVRVGEYETLDSEQKAAHLTWAIDQHTNGPFKSGVGRFECLFETIGLHGTVAEETRKGLFELQQVRNAIVHKRGIADEKLCKSCPWIGLKTGDAVLVGEKSYVSYYQTVQQYLAELLCRTGVVFGVPDARARVQAFYQKGASSNMEPVAE